jgi:hypothetical protein
MATRSGTAARTRLRTAVRRKSWAIGPALPASGGPSARLVEAVFRDAPSRFLRACASVLRSASIESSSAPSPAVARVSPDARRARCCLGYRFRRGRRGDGPMPEDIIFRLSLIDGQVAHAIQSRKPRRCHGSTVFVIVQPRRTWNSRRRLGRPTVPADVRALIRTMAQPNPRWGAPRIHGELPKLRIDVCQATSRNTGTPAPAAVANLAHVPAESTSVKSWRPISSWCRLRPTASCSS